jgi:hypothetical protein
MGAKRKSAPAMTLFISSTAIGSRGTDAKDRPSNRVVPNKFGHIR